MLLLLLTYYVKSDRPISAESDQRLTNLPPSLTFCVTRIESARLGSVKYQFLSHWFDSTSVQTHEVRISRPTKTGIRLSTHSAIPSGTLDVLKKNIRDVVC